jgi:hypothetical protein
LTQEQAFLVKPPGPGVVALVADQMTQAAERVDEGSESSPSSRQSASRSSNSVVVNNLAHDLRRRLDLSAQLPALLHCLDGREVVKLLEAFFREGGLGEQIEPTAERRG